jgi:Bacterial protein of unknown function (DUF885)
MRARLIATLMVLSGTTAAADELDDLSRDFWEWRRASQPLTGDDIPRIERPKDWVPDWSPESVAARIEALTELEVRYLKLDPGSWPISRKVDYRLIGSALARARWELDVLRDWRRNPLFYHQQTLGSIFEVLLPPPPVDDERKKQVLLRVREIPRTIEAAKRNLDEGVAPFARLTIASLDGVRGRLEAVGRELSLDFEDAIVALESYRAWLQERVSGMPEATAVGRDRYQYFLHHVALLPYTPEELVLLARQEWERSVAFEGYESLRNRELPELPYFPTQKAQIEAEVREEEAIRRFLEDKDILTVPDWMKHYRNLPLPPYLRPLSHLGVNDDLTSATRLTENATAYIPEPSPDLPYFYRAIARDPRPIIVHEGVPGHYFQLALSWSHENPIRRRYYDSGANEGIGFYAEEMMVQMGLFDDRPRVREILYNFMRLRALRVEVDVKLGLGEFTIDQAAEYLETRVPMDRQTAREEAAFFASSPGQAISYQIGKIQIVKLLADARTREGEGFRLRRFHDFLWKNGNVPLALQRWEYLDDPSDVEKLDSFQQ